MKLKLPPKGSRKDYYKKVLLGSNESRGLLMNVVVYVLLITIAFIYLYPVLYMFSRSLMTSRDLLDASAAWIPSQVTFNNYASAMATMDYWNSLWKNVQLVLIPTILQVFICSWVGYGFARYNFPGKMIWMGILLLSFLLPTQVTSLPNYIQFSGMTVPFTGEKFLNGSVLPFATMAALGQGFRSALCILIFYNFHRQTPQSLIEAAEIDGAGHIKAYFRIAIPLSLAAVVVVTLFSVIWYWNDTELVRTFLGYSNTRNTGLTTLMLELGKFEDSYNATFGTHAQSTTSTNHLNEAIKMAGTMLAIAPMLVMYLFLQKQFVESVDRAGITGE